MEYRHGEFAILSLPLYLLSCTSSVEEHIAVIDPCVLPPETLLFHDIILVLIPACNLTNKPTQGIFNHPQTQGHLYIYNYTSPNSKPTPIKLLDFPSANSDFHPLGIEYHHPSRTLYVINHAQSGTSLEIFRVYPQENAATHLKTITHPQIHSPNSLAVIDETNLYITNDHYFLSRYHSYLAKLETWLAPASGNVIHFNILTETATHLDRVAFANGVVLLDEKTLAVASTTKAEVYVYHAPNGGIDNGRGGPYDREPALYLKSTISIPFLPDNLSFDSHSKKLLVAGHAHPFTMDPFAKSRDACNSGEGEAQKKACNIRTSTGVAEWSEKTGLKVLWMGDEFATGSTAVRDGKRGVGIVSGLYEKGLLVWRE